MKQLLPLFLFLLPCLAWAQYPSNGNQKITLGEQTTADGLIYRGVAADTTLTAKSDTAAYFVLDTVNINLYTYKATATGRKWIQVETDSTSIAYVKTYGTQTVNGAKTFTTAPTFSTALLGGSGGSGITSFGAANRIPYAASTTALTTASNLTFINSGNRTLQVSASNNNEVALFKALNAASQSFEVGVWGSTTDAFGAIANSNAYTYGATDFATVVANDAGTVKWGIGTGGAERMRLEGIDGELKIGYGATDNGAYKLQVNSQIFATNATIATSDIRFKENIQPLDKGLEIINKLKPVKFNFISTTENNFSEFDEIGFIAQDVEGALSTELFAKAVVKKLDEDKDDSALGLMTEKLIPILVKAIQEQQALIKALEQRIINLENK